MPRPTLPAHPPAVTHSVRRTPAPSAREVALGLTGVALVAFLPWAYGGTTVVAQQIAAGLAGAMLVLAWCGRETAQRRWRTFPIFWGGLIVIAYVVMQFLNPAYAYQRESDGWWLEARVHVAWLPAGMRTPFEIANPIRTLLPWFSAWAILCACWRGMNNQRLIGRLLGAVAIHGAAFAVFALLQKASGSGTIYGTLRPESGNFVGAILYANHAAAWFNLLTALNLALALHRWERDRHRPAGSSPAIVFFLCAVACAAGTLLTVSFSGIAFLCLEVVIAAALTLPRWKKQSATGRRAALAVGTGLCALLLLCGGRVVFSRLEDHFSNKLADWGAASAGSRVAAYTRGVDMWRDRWLLGWGAGSFRYGFTKYSRDMTQLPDQPERRFFWEHLHNDWLEALIELGLFGFAPITVLVAWWLRRQFQQRVWRDPPRAMLTFGVFLLGIFACVDFPLKNPAVLLTAALLAGLADHWRQEGLSPTREDSKRRG